MTITILGTGYVGLTTATLLAHCGHTVYAVEPNKERLDVIKTGRSFFYEEGLDDLVKHVVDSGALIPTDSYEESVPSSDIVFSSVGTPDKPDGSSNLDYVFGAAEEAAKLLKDGTIYVQKSTVPVGTGTKVRAIFDGLGKQIAYVSNPEFLREGTALADTLWFDRIVVGSDNKNAAEKVLSLYRELAAQRDTIAALTALTKPAKIPDGEYIATSQNSAELIKVTANAFLALKITFANSIAILADKTGANVKEVMDAVGADKRIGRAFLNAGRGYGGGCFPKDVSGLIASAEEFGAENLIMQAAAEVNAGMAAYVVEKIQAGLDGELEGKKVAVLGLAFKAGTSDSRKSPAIKIANLLVDAGAIVSAYDPKAIEEAKETLSPEVTTHEMVIDAITGVDAVCLATDWPEIVSYDAAELARAMKGNLFVDAMNAYDAERAKAAKLNYIGIGRS